MDAEDYDSDDTWESDLESEAEIAEIMQVDIAEDAPNTGKKEYLAKYAPHLAQHSFQHCDATHAHTHAACHMLPTMAGAQS